MTFGQAIGTAALAFRFVTVLSDRAFTTVCAPGVCPCIELHVGWAIVCACACAYACVRACLLVRAFVHSHAHSS
jgi:hypothetical protein